MRLNLLRILLVAAVLSPACAGAAELVMLERPGCVWCARWNAEIGPAYPQTAEGRRAPLRRVDVGAGWPVELAGIRPEMLTPTFILLDGGREVARLRGYPGDEFFWFLLGQMLSRLPGDDGTLLPGEGARATPPPRDGD